MKPEDRKTREKTMVNRWKDPEYRKKMLEKQKAIGYRTYGSGIFYSTNKTRRLQKETKEI